MCDMRLREVDRTDGQTAFNSVLNDGDLLAKALRLAGVACLASATAEQLRPPARSRPPTGVVAARVLAGS